MGASVSIVRSADYDPRNVRLALENTFELHGGFARFVQSGDRVLLKPNFVSSIKAQPETYTHPEVIGCAAEMVREAGGKAVIGDSPALGSARGIIRKLGLEERLRRAGAEVVEFRRGVKIPNEKGKVFRHLHIAREVLAADKVINLAKLKSHQQLYLTGAVKNCFGCVTGKRKAWWHFKAGGMGNYFSRMLVETWNLVNPTFNLVDGVMGMEGQGPTNGNGKFIGVFLGGQDAPAIDRVICDLIGADADKLRTLGAARELELGTVDTAAIEIKGESIDEVRLTDFQFPKLSAIGFSLPRIVRSTLKQAWTLRNEAA